MLTVSERKELAIEKIRKAIGVLKIELSTYAKAHHGRFIMFGSAATGRLKFDSDIDILVDFSLDDEGDAWRFVENACANLDLVHDVTSIRFVSDEFLKHIEKEIQVLP